MTKRMELKELVDLSLYPIDKLDSTGVDLLSRCRKLLHQSAMCYLPNFLTSRTLSLLQDEIMSVRHRAFRNNAPRPVYAWRDQTQYSPTHIVAQKLPNVWARLPAIVSTLTGYW